ncbi:MAG: calcineurin-like phosphoesterase C-terminal domain-containing protein [Proteiniphilum sp.]|jgi:3',5'-cyclic AMP phosphodiesterase CpdA|nr:calcineurin-like phosphoesterase C-terminal domain-containing protein [Proteiniphilum sp.]
MKKNLLVLTLLFSSSILAYSQQTANGYVYDDANRNGKKERREAGIPNVAVSNGVDVALTDDKGFYTLPVSDGNTIFVIKPSGYKTPVDENFIPRFYYHHKPEGSPESFTYKGVSPTGNLPKSIDFALRKQDEPENFTAVIFGDPQPYSIQDMDYFTEKVVNDVKKTDKTLFGVSLGDIAGDNLNLHPVYKERMRRLELPWYNVMGNHDMNYEATTDELSDETFVKNFGSANYAFNYGKAHFIILDNILYPDPRSGKGYWGGYREDQLIFLENNLKYVPKDRLVVLSQHIHMKDNSGGAYRLEDRQRVFDLLKDYENVLIMSAHTHLQDQIEYREAEGWKGKKPLHEYNVATTSGDWYSGKLDENGWPDATMRDGTPQGYAFLNINGNQYDVDYKVAGKESDYQMNIFAPKVVAYKRGTTSQIVVNFFIGSQNDLVEYRIDEGEWRKMRYTSAPDLNYLIKLLEWDFTEELLPGRRPSNPEDCTHLWSAPVQADLPAGKHTIEVRATDRYGKIHSGKRTYSILE